MKQALLVELLDYDAETGALTWKLRDRRHFASDWSCRVWNSQFPDRAAGGLGEDGYTFVSIKGKSYRAHRIIWLMVYGRLTGPIDHINGDRTDNRLANLRAVSVAENNRNVKRRRDNKSGVTGVDFKRSECRWRAQIAVGGRDIHLGYFDTKDAAIAARKLAERQHGFHANHGTR